MRESVAEGVIGIKPASSKSSGQCTYCPLSQSGTCPYWFDEENWSFDLFDQHIEKIKASNEEEESGEDG